MSDMAPTSPQTNAGPEELRDLYLDLLMKGLTHLLYAGSDAVGFTSKSPLRRRVFGYLRDKRGIVLMRILPDQEKTREEGKDWPMFAQTMVGLARLKNYRSCIEAVIADGVPGDILEAGVWRGGASIFARGVLKAHGVTDRTIYAADSFEGLPPANAELYPADGDSPTEWHLADHLAVSLETVQDNFRRYDLLDDQVKFLKGWFKDTLPTVKDRTWAVVRLDGDMYESTMDGLNNLYDGLSSGGFLIIDDYQIPECRRAVTDFREQHGIDAPIQEVDWTGVFWRKP